MCFQFRYLKFFSLMISNLYQILNCSLLQLLIFLILRGNFFKSSKQFTSLSGSKFSFSAYSSQKGDPVDGWKCQATISAVCASSFSLVCAILFSSATLNTGGVSVVSAGIEVALSGIGVGLRGVSPKARHFQIGSEVELNDLFEL